MFPILFVAFFLVLLIGATPEPTTSDSADLALAAFSLAPAHPPGYLTAVFPLKAFTLLPFGPIAFRCAAAGACFSAAGIGLMALGLRSIFGSILPAALAVTLMGLAPLTLSQSARVEVYGISLLLAGSIVHAWMAWRQRRRPGHAMALFFLAALAIIHHPEMSCFAFPALLCALLEKPRPSPTLIASGAFLSLSAAGLLAALVFRANESWETASLAIASFGDFVYYATAEGFRNFVPFTLDGPYRMLLHAFRTIFHQYGSVVWAVLAVGTVSLWRRDRTLALGVILGVIINFAVFIKGGILPEYSMFLADTHALSTTWLLSIILAEGVRVVLQWARRDPRLIRPQVRRWAGMLILSAALLQAAPNLGAMVSSGRTYLLSRLAHHLPESGTLFSNSYALHYYVLYLRNVEGRSLSTPVYFNRVEFDPGYLSHLANERGIHLLGPVETLPQPVYDSNLRPAKSFRGGTVVPLPDGLLLSYPPLHRPPHLYPTDLTPTQWPAAEPEWLVFLQWLSLHRAEAFFERGDLAEAERETHMALEFLPRNPAPHVLLGNILAAQQRHEPARDSYLRAIELITQPKSWSGQGALSAFLDSVVAERPNAYSMEPFLVQAHNGLGISHMKTGGPAEAAHYLADGLSLAEHYGFELEARILRSNLALAYAQVGEIDRAVQVYEDLLRRDPSDVDALTQATSLLLDSGRFDDARAHAEDLLHRAKSASHLYLAGAVFLRTGQAEKAVATLERVVSAEETLSLSERRQAHLLLSNAYQYTRQFDKAEMHRRIAQDLPGRHEK